MAMDDVEQDGESHPMGGVDQALEVFRRSVSGGDGEEGGDLVSERGVVRVLHYGHPN